MSEVELLNRIEVKLNDPKAQFTGKQIKILHNLAQQPEPELEDEKKYKCHDLMKGLLIIARKNFENLDKFFSKKKPEKVVLKNKW